MQRLSFFPTPYPDECFYSIFCRYYVRSGISSSEVVTKQFFGCDRSLLVSTIYFPRKFERLDYWVSPESGITSGDLICSHTAYPYHSISYIDDVYRQMEKAIREGIPENGIDSLVRRMMSKGKYTSTGQYLRYCPECVRDDIKKYGETYWHRLPQLPGVVYCPEHGCEIKNSSAPLEEMRVRIYPASYVLRDMKCGEENIHLRYRDEYLSIARETAWLLEHGRLFGGQKEVSRKYREMMRERNYIDFHGTKSDGNALRQDFVERYGERFIKELLPYDGDPFYWLRYLRECIGFNLRPLHHILLMKFFAGTVEGFLNIQAKPEMPYGNGPWPCANKICSYYRKNSAVRKEIHKKGDTVWAWFECPYCGMRYRRSDPDQTFDEYLKNTCISNKGFLYDQRMEEYFSDSEMSMDEIAGLLGIGVGTVVRYARKKKIDLGGRLTASYYYWENNNNEERTAFYRRRVQEELQKTPVMSCKDVKERIPGAYRWLVMKDPEWLHARLVHEFDKPRWQEWGQAALVELKAAYAEIRSSGNPKKRVNVNWLARAAGINRDLIYSRLRYLPEMQKFFEEVCETQEAWIRRRYTEIAMEKKRAGGTEFTYDDVKRKVQIRRDSYKRNKELIEELIIELNNTMFAGDG